MSDVRPLLLCTDLDRTLLPNGAQPESSRAREAFSRLVAHPAVTLAYVSGRDRVLIERAMISYDLPRPALVVGDVGTSIFDLRAGRWARLDAWQREICRDWNGHDWASLAAALAPLSALRLQERSKQNTYKLSYYVPLQAERSVLDAEITKRLQGLGVVASLVWSVDEPAGIGLLDVLPGCATKLHAVQFVRELLGMPVWRTVFAGDSGNDLPVLVSEIPAVLVANAMRDVAAQACAQARDQGRCAALYIASGKVLGMNGNYSAGIIEGVLHYHPELAALLEDFDAAGSNRCGRHE